MAKDIDQVDSNVKIGIDYEELKQAMSVIQKSSEKAVKNLNTLKEGYKAVLGNLKGSAKVVEKSIENATQELKPLSQQLKAISTATAGTTALRNQAAVKGVRTGLLFGDDTAANAQIVKALVSRQKALEKASQYLSDQATISAGRGKITQTNINDLRQIEGLDRRLGTIQLRLMANYKAINMVTGAFRYLINYTVEYDKELHQLQAIAAVSDTTMVKLKDSIQAVASSTKFTSLEVAQAGTVLAQAGLSARQIEETLPAIARLATATGTDLATSTDVVTSTLNIYSLQASEAEHVTNALTTAMNESKADIAGFQKAIQYAGNYAAQLGVTYEETAAVISAATQAGIRSRSMLGTGLRAVLAEFLNPTKKLVAQLEKVGLTVSDIDVRSKGLSTVLKTLKSAGFGATEAFRGMERRGAAFLASIINQTEFIDTLRDHMAGSTAAAEANEIQMRSLGNQIKNFQSIMGTAAYEGLAPFEKILARILKSINEFLGGNSVGKLGTFLGTLGTSLTGAAGIYGFLTVIRMVGSSLGNLAVQIKNLGNVAKVSGIVSVFKTLVSKGNLIITVLAGIASGLAYLGEKFGWFTSGADKAVAAMEEANGEYEKAKEKGDALAGMYERLYEQREKLQDQTERDIFLREILTRFPEAAKYVDDLRISFEGLAKVLSSLNAEQAAEEAEKAAEKARVSAEQNFKVIKALGEKYFQDSDYQLIRDANGFYVESESYNKLINAMRGTRGFENLNYQNLMSRSRAYTSTLGLHGTQTGYEQAASRYFMQGLYNELRSQIDWNTTDSNKLRVQYGDLLTSARLVKGDEGKVLLAVIKQLGEEINDLANAIDTGEIKAIKEVEAQFSEQSAAEVKELVKLKEQAEDIKNKIAQEMKFGRDTAESKQMVDELLKIYGEQERRLSGMDETVRNPDGTRKEFRDYSWNELATYTGKTEAAINEMKKALSEAGIKDENRIKEIIAGRNERNQKLDSIRAYMEVIEAAIEQSAYGKVEFNDRFQLAKNRAEAIKALNAVSSSRDAKQAATNAEKYIRMMTSNAVEEAVKGASLAGGLSADQTEALRGKIRETNALKITGDYTNKSFDLNKALSPDALIKLNKAYEEVGGSMDKNEKVTEAFTEALGQQTITASIANAELVKFNNNSSKVTDGISAAQTGMESFFHKLNTDIKEIDMAYTNATRSMDQMLAVQQGVITGLERVYGSGSVTVKAEQVRLQKMQDAQLEKRNEALETKLSGYSRQLEVLRSNPEYQQAKQLYDNAFAAWKAAEAGGDQKAINQTFRNLQTVSKGWDKLATKEESLTSKIADLQDEIIKNTEAINKENEERRINTNGGNPFTQIRRGFGDAATNYIDEAEKQGYGTLRGEAGIMGEGIIKSLDDSLVTLFDNITTKSKTAKESFKEFGQSIIQTIGDIAKQLLAKQIVMSLLGGMGSLFGGGEVTTSGGGWSSGFSNSALGGLVTGPIKNRDSVPTMLMPGEYVLKKSAVDSLGRDYLDSLNNKSATVMAGYSSEVTEAKSETTETGTQSGKGVVNVYVVAQEQQQQMTPQDVVVTITQDMITGGQTKKLVKSIAMGAI